MSSETTGPMLRSHSSQRQKRYPSGDEVRAMIAESDVILVRAQEALAQAVDLSRRAKRMLEEFGA